VFCRIQVLLKEQCDSDLAFQLLRDIPLFFHLLLINHQFIFLFLGFLALRLSFAQFPAEKVIVLGLIIFAVIFLATQFLNSKFARFFPIRDAFQRFFSQKAKMANRAYGWAKTPGLEALTQGTNLTVPHLRDIENQNRWNTSLKKKKKINKTK